MTYKELEGLLRKMPKDLKHHKVKMFLYCGEYPGVDDFKIYEYPVTMYME